MNKGLVILTENSAVFEQLEDEELGACIRALMAHSSGEKIDIENLPRTVRPVYRMLVLQADRFQEKYEESSRRRSEAAQRREAARRDAEQNTKEHNVPQCDTPCPIPNPIPNPNPTLHSNVMDKGKRSTRFTPPTLDEVKTYCQERNNGVNPERFVDFYAAKDWMIGKNRMKDWKAAVRNWEKDERAQAPAQKKPSFDFEQRHTDYDELIRKGLL